MAQDETYQTKVYLEQGGNRFVVGSGGEITIESGGTLSIPAGAVYVGSGGNMTILSGGQLSVATAGSMTIGSGGLMTVASGGAWSVATAGSAAVGSGGLFHILSGGAFSIATGGSGVVGSGGTFTVASGGTLSIAIGGSIVFDSGGTLTMLSGAGMSMESSVNWGLAGANFAVDDARRILASELAGTVIITASSTRLSVLNLPKNVRTVILSGTSNMIAGSFWLTSVSAGREVLLVLGGNSNSTASAMVKVSLSGCALLGSTGLPVSTFGMYNSLASHPMVQLKAIEDNVWAIIFQKGDINESI